MSIFYKNDQPSGFAVTLSGDDARQTLKAFERSYQKFKALPPEIREERLTRGAEEDLRRAVQIKPHTQDSIDDENLFLTLGPLTIYILEREGRMASDEFNGCQYIYESRPRM